MRRLGFLLAVFIVSSAWADAPIALEADRTQPAEQRLYALGGTAGFGLGALMAPSDGRARALEVYAALNDATVEARYGESFRFLRRGKFDWTAHASGSLLCTVQGKESCGLGAFGGLSFGWGERWWNVFFGSSVGAEGYVSPAALRFPARLSMGTRFWVGEHVVLGLTARAGADLEARLAPAGRADIVVDVGWFGTAAGAQRPGLSRVSAASAP